MEEKAWFVLFLDTITSFEKSFFYILLFIIFENDIFPWGLYLVSYLAILAVP